MILVDTSVWIDHLRATDDDLTRLLNGGQVLVHPFVVGELALGNLANRETVLSALRGLPQAQVATDQEVQQLIRVANLFGTGTGYIDAHLLASARLSVGALLWTRDKRLSAASADLGLNALTRH